MKESKLPIGSLLLFVYIGGSDVRFEFYDIIMNVFDFSICVVYDILHAAVILQCANYNC